jgi:hypothetical protein
LGSGNIIFFKKNFLTPARPWGFRSKTGRGVETKVPGPKLSPVSFQIACLFLATPRRGRAGPSAVRVGVFYLYQPTPALPVNRLYNFIFQYNFSAYSFWLSLKFLSLFKGIKNNLYSSILM